MPDDMDVRLDWPDAAAPTASTPAPRATRAPVGPVGADDDDDGRIRVRLAGSGRLAQLQAEVDALRSEVEALRTEVGELRARLDGS